MDVLDLVAKIKLDLDEYEKGLGEAEKKADTFGSKFKKGLGTAAKVSGAAIAGTVAAAGALGKTLVSNANELAIYGDTIDKESQKLGISAKAYQEWDAVLQHTGGSIDSIKPAMKTLAKEAMNNSDAFQQLGISQEEVANLSKEEIFAKTISALQDMPEGMERTRLATQLLGRSSVELGALLNTSAEDTQAMKDRVNELGGVMSDEAVKDAAKFKDNLQDMQTAMAGVKRGIMSDTLPAFSSLMDGFTKLITGEEGADEALNEGMDKLGQAIEQMMPKIGNLLENLLPRVLEFGGQLISGIAQQIPQIIVAIAKQIPSLVKTLLKTIAKLIPQMIKAGADLITELANGMGDGGGEVLDIIMDILDNLVSAIMDNLPQILNAGLTIVENLVMGILQKLPDIVVAAADIITHLIEGIVQMLPEILKKGKDVILNIVHGITQNLPQIIQAVVQVINTLLTTITENLPEILQAGIDILLELVSGLLDAIPDLIAAIPQIITALVDGLLSLDNLGKLLDAGVQLIGEMVEGLLKFILDAPEKAGKIVGALVGGLIDCIGDMLSAGKKLMNKFWEGLKSVAEDIYDWAADTGANVIDALTGGNIKKKQAANQEMFDSLKDETGQIRAGTDELRAKYSNTSSSTSGMYDPSDRYKHYAKAMDNAYLLDGATIFGMMDGLLLEGGERGQEMVVGTNYLAGMIADAMVKVNANNQPENIIIPVYIGNERITEVVVNAQNMHNYVTGGR